MSPFGELLEELVRAEVRFILVGGTAVLLHGHMRTTNDLDILIDATPDNAARLIGVLAAWGEGAGGQLPPEELTVPALGALRVIEDFALDIFTLMRSRRLDREFRYQDLEAGALRRTLSNGSVVAYVSITQLVDLKAGTGRAKDQSDIEVLTEIARGRRTRVVVDLAAIVPAEGGVASGDEEWPTPPAR